MVLMQAYRSIKGRARRAIIGEPVFWDRIVLDQETRKIIGALPASRMDALEISGDNGKAYPFRSFKSANFPEYDICKEPIDLEAFDIVLAEQVFEHLLYPYRAARNVYAMLRPGGYFFISTPFLQKIHNFPVDCSRWTPLGMKYFLAEAGFPLETIQTWSWGNRSVIRATFRTSYFPYYNRFIHSLKNAKRPSRLWFGRSHAKRQYPRSINPDTRSNPQSPEVSLLVGPAVFFAKQRAMRPGHKDA